MSCRFSASNPVPEVDLSQEIPGLCKVQVWLPNSASDSDDAVPVPKLKLYFKNGEYLGVHTPWRHLQPLKETVRACIKELGLPVPTFQYNEAPDRFNRDLYYLEPDPSFLGVPGLKRLFVADPRKGHYLRSTEKISRFPWELDSRAKERPYIVFVFKVGPRVEIPTDDRIVHALSEKVFRNFPKGRTRFEKLLDS